MEKILVIEDNKTLAKLISKKIESDLKIHVDVAYSLSEAKLFLKTYKYFLVLADLNLPDAPDGEVVDYALSKGHRVIVLSGSVDHELRKKLLKKNIIDYVKKSGVDDIRYIIQTVKRLKKNQNHKVLAVEDSIVFRKELKDKLENLFFKVITVAHGEEALGILSMNPDISLIITDYNMPVMNGLDLTAEVRKSKSKKELAIIAISSDNDEDTNAKFLKYGANDYINKPFSNEEFYCRINNAVDALENNITIKNIAKKDYLTGLYNRPSFFKEMQKYLSTTIHTGEKYAIALIDIDNFKYINNNYGHQSGDDVIIHLAKLIRKQITHESLISRFAGEEFCVVLKNIEPNDAIDIFENLSKSVEETQVISDSQSINFTVSIGLSVKHDFSLDGSINQADMLLYEAKESGKNQVIHN